jgi:hypothetical protein
LHSLEEDDNLVTCPALDIGRRRLEILPEILA